MFSPWCQDGILLGAVGAYDWNGAVLKETSAGKVIPHRESYLKEFPEELKNHAAYLGEALAKEGEEGPGWRGPSVPVGNSRPSYKAGFPLAISHTSCQLLNTYNK